MDEILMPIVEEFKIPSEYIFYKWAYIILVGWMIIEEVIRQLRDK